jgi:hypothetical protein
MPAVLSSPLGRTRVSSHKFFAHPTSCRSILAFPAPRRSARTRRHASPCAIAPPPAARWQARGTLAAQIPITEPAARPTERTSRDFVPWRFSDAGYRSAWLDRRCRRPKTCTTADVSGCSKVPAYSITSSARARSLSGTSRPSALTVTGLSTRSNLVDCITGNSVGLLPLRIRPA